MDGNKLTGQEAVRLRGPGKKKKRLTPLVEKGKRADTFSDLIKRDKKKSDTTFASRTQKKKGTKGEKDSFNLPGGGGKKKRKPYVPRNPPGEGRETEQVLIDPGEKGGGRISLHLKEKKG